MIIGYTAGVFDAFHYGHVNLLRNARSLCDKLIVGLTVDKLVSYKGTKSLFTYEERFSVVDACKYVDLVVPQMDMDKISTMTKLKCSKLFVGDDWYGTNKWQQYEQGAIEHNIEIVYLPYTKSISTSELKERLIQL
ncbi:adenylyltransferase/cytidyltransferase family protein [Roseobacter sp. HKCCA2468]|uniref:adenylyltransferase/cytidyltransferase family protein n=1 Tax=Roseobacter sp. HKCCA2468 TaxID=3120342 RepID=UPI0030ECC763